MKIKILHKYLMLILIMSFSMIQAATLLSQNNIDGDRGIKRYYTINVPANSTALKVLLSNVTGDPDLYVRYGAKPTILSYDCRPYHTKNRDETCNMDTPQAGTWHIMIDAYKDFSGATLTATVEGGGGGVPVDTEVPVITLLGGDIVLKVGNRYIEQGAIAIDNRDGNITDKIIQSNTVNTSIVGSYTVTYNVSDIAGNSADEVTRVVIVKEGVNKSDVIFGARSVKATPLNEGTLFISPLGNGDTCTNNDPCSIYTAFNKAKAGDVLFLKGGIYDITNNSLVLRRSGTKDNPIIVESYPGERAILDGHATFNNAKELGKKVPQAIYIAAKEYITIRKIEIRNMGGKGIYLLESSHNTVEGCTIHDNYYIGIQIYRNDKSNYNLIRDNIIYNNSDAGLLASTTELKTGYLGYKNGNNADGISISSGNNNKIIHNTVYHNSDDGIDTWKSNDTYIAYNKVFNNGLDRGDGNGIKAGGDENYLGKIELPPYGKNAIIEFNIAYNNKANGIDVNLGRNVTFRYNTSYNNVRYGFLTIADTKVMHNIASHNHRNNASRYIGGGNYVNEESVNNSWTIDNEIVYISTDTESVDFLKPLEGTVYENMGAYAGYSQAKVFIIGDSTVHNQTQGEMGWGTAFGTYMKQKENLMNQARVGASSKSYHTGGTHNWAKTKELMQDIDINKGAYLLIQFGHNDEHIGGVEYTEPGRGNAYYTYLKGYVDEAKALGVIPVLITPVSRLWKNDRSHGEYPQTVRALAEDENILVLDLQAKSYNAFNSYPSHDAIISKFAYDDHTHFSPSGAKIVAGWVKALACEASLDLCKLLN